MNPTASIGFRLSEWCIFGALNIRDTVRPAAEGKGTTGMLPTFVIGLREGVEAALIVIANLGRTS